MGCYGFIKDDLGRVVESSRTTRKYLASFNTTFIALVPEIANMTRFENFQPIHYVIASIKSYHILFLEC